MNVRIFFLFFVLTAFTPTVQARAFSTLQGWANTVFSTYPEYCQTNTVHPIPPSLLEQSDIEGLIRSVGGSRLTANTGPFIEKVQVAPDAQIAITGDIHGAIHGLLRNLLRLVTLGYLNNDFSLSTTKNIYLVFTGDYIDRSIYGLDVLYTLLKLKEKNPNRVFLLRGNHEDFGIYSSYGFAFEVRQKFGLMTAPTFFNLFNSFCNSVLSEALFLGVGDFGQAGAAWVLLCHGGINTMDPSIRIKDFLNTKAPIGTIETLDVLSEPDTRGWTWSDFENTGTPVLVQRRDRPYASEQATRTFLTNWNLKAIFRGHQHSNYGLKIGGDEPGVQAAWSTYSQNNGLNLDGQILGHPSSRGFALDRISYPVFTFTTASSDVIQLPYDSFGILSAAARWSDWRLMPYVFNLNNTTRNEKFVEILHFNKIPASLHDPLEFTWRPTAASEPIPATLFPATTTLITPPPIPPTPATSAPLPAPQIPAQPTLPATPAIPAVTQPVRPSIIPSVTITKPLAPTPPAPQPRPLQQTVPAKPQTQPVIAQKQPIPARQLSAKEQATMRKKQVAEDKKRAAQQKAALAARKAQEAKARAAAKKRELELAKQRKLAAQQAAKIAKQKQLEERKRAKIAAAERAKKAKLEQQRKRAEQKAQQAALRKKQEEEKARLFAALKKKR